MVSQGIHLGKFQAAGNFEPHGGEAKGAGGSLGLGLGWLWGLGVTSEVSGLQGHWSPVTETAEGGLPLPHQGDVDGINFEKE